MITGWGSHHVDIAHWGMDTELTGPIQVEGKGEFPKNGLWNVHGAYHIEMKYANGVTMVIDNNFPNGVRFEGDEGWIFVSRGGGKPDPAKPDRESGIRGERPGDPKARKSAPTESTCTRAMTITWTGSKVSRPASRPQPRRTGAPLHQRL